MMPEQVQTISTNYRNKNAGEEININDGVNETVLVNGHDFAKAKIYANYYNSLNTSLGRDDNYEINQGYIDFYYYTRYGNGFSFGSLFDSGPDKRKMPTRDEDTMILLEMPDIGRGPLKSSLRAVGKGAGKALAKKDAKKTSGWVTRKVFDSLDPSIQKKVKNAISKGIVAPEGQQGIIRLSATEATSTGYK